MLPVQKSPTCHRGPGAVAQIWIQLLRILHIRDHRRLRIKSQRSIEARLGLSLGGAVDKGPPWKQSKRWLAILRPHPVKAPLSRSPRRNHGCTGSTRTQLRVPHSKIQGVAVTVERTGALEQRKSLVLKHPGRRNPPELLCQSNQQHPLVPVLAESLLMAPSAI
jgi:hypothetical protein